MIVTRTPYRIPLGGGGTDLPSYYSKYEGFLITAAINKYIYVTLNKRFEGNFRVSHHIAIEIQDNADEIQHPVIREAIKLLNINDGIEIVSVADIPPNTGMGSSGTFGVGLLHALHNYARNPISTQELAEHAYKIEVEILNRVSGKQDQYAAAFGGIICLNIDKDGEVEVSPVTVSEDILKELESNLLLFYTGVKRDAPQVQAKQNEATRSDERQVIEALHTIKEIGRESKKAIERGRLRYFGELLDIHWRTKKRLSDEITSKRIDRLHEIAMKSGAVGGKIMGAGGGGFFMFYSEGDARNHLREAMAREGLQEFPFRIDFEGSKVLINDS
jgi:D-glycero-alpha-D-manno-heptose-7-phosphate kinase